MWHFHLYPSQSWCSIYGPWRNTRLSWPSWLITCRGDISTWKRSPIPVLAGLDVKRLRPHYTKSPTWSAWAALAAECQMTSISLTPSIIRVSMSTRGPRLTHSRPVTTDVSSAAVTRFTVVASDMVPFCSMSDGCPPWPLAVFFFSRRCEPLLHTDNIVHQSAIIYDTVALRHSKWYINTEVSQ